MNNHYTLYKDDLPNDLLKEFIKKGSVAVDTEFMGLDLQFGNLYLVQLSSGDGYASLVQLNPKKKYVCLNLKKLFTNKNIQKIFHYARADMGVIKMNLGIDVKNVFCTKIASKIVRKDSEKHSLQVLVNEICGVFLDKESQLSDWSQKKLTDKQLFYAANDVLYLHEIKKFCLKMLKLQKSLKYFDKCIDFLPTIVDLDVLGLQNIEIFSHH